MAPALDFKICYKLFSMKNVLNFGDFTTFPLLEKIHYCNPPWKNPSDAHAGSYVTVSEAVRDSAVALETAIRGSFEMHG